VWAARARAPRGARASCMRARAGVRVRSVRYVFDTDIVVEESLMWRLIQLAV
jgi:hypothetical protein